VISTELINAAWRELKKSVIYYRGEPIGTVAARDSNSKDLNYNQCFTRDFAVSSLAFLMRGETDVVRNFLTVLVELQSIENHMKCFKAGRGLMPASFAVKQSEKVEELVPDFGEYAIARVAPVDSGFWWLILLRAYVQASGDVNLAGREEFQQAIKLIVELSLVPRFDMFPTMLVPDGGYMIDRRMGVYGYPFDIQALFFTALCSAQELLIADNEHHVAVTDRLAHLAYHIRHYYWLDMRRLNEIYRYKVEEYGKRIINEFNIYPETIPLALMDWMPSEGGYFVGNLGPARMDFRYFAQGNLLAVVSSLATEKQANGIMDLIAQRWDDLIGQMPLKLCFPALEGCDWEIITGRDLKNSPWSYHNGGSWPFLLWLLTAAAQKTGRAELAARALKTAAARLADENWPEYFDGRDGRLVGKEARRFQTWTVAGFLTAQQLLADPAHLNLLNFDEKDSQACE
jgi:hypothetical protein